MFAAVKNALCQRNKGGRNSNNKDASAEDGDADAAEGRGGEGAADGGEAGDAGDASEDGIGLVRFDGVDGALSSGGGGRSGVNRDTLLKKSMASVAPYSSRLHKNTI